MGRSQFGRDASRRTGGSNGGSGSGNVSQITSVDGSVTVSPLAGTGIVDLSVNDRSFVTTATVASAAGAVWDGITVTGVGTLTGAVNVTNVAGFNSFSYAQPTVTSASALTVSYSATVAIVGPPIAAGSATITNKYSLWVQSGNTRFDGYIVMGTSIPAVFATPAVPLQIYYNNTSAAFPGIILDSTAPGLTGRSLIELRQQNITHTKWWSDTNGDCYVEAARDYNIKVDQLSLIKTVANIAGSTGTTTFNYLVVTKYLAANNVTTNPILRLDANGGDQCVISFRNVYATDTYFRADSNGQMNCDPATSFNVNPNANSVRRLRVTSAGVMGSELSGADLILDSTEHATKGNITMASRTIVGATADISGGTYTSGVQIQNASSANLILGRTSSHASTTLANVGFFNGSTQVALISPVGGGATDAGHLYIYTKATGTAIAACVFITSAGRSCFGYAADITAGTVTTGIQVAGAATNQGNVVTGRQTAATTGICSALFGYNGTNYIAHHGFYANGANDSGYQGFFCKKTGVAVTEVMRLDPVAAANETALLIERNLAGTFTLQRVSMDAVDTAGTGFRGLRVPN